MQNGKPYPHISRDIVRAALEGMLYTARLKPQPNPLLALTLVDEQLLNPDFPLTHHARQLVVQHLLVNIITEQLTLYRKILDFEPLNPTSSLEFSKRDLSHVAASDNSELIAWSLLYYRYVRVEFAFDVKTFEQLCGLDERTIRRYIAHGIRRMTDYLVNCERESRDRYRARRLHKELGHTVAIKLFGRDKTKAQVAVTLKGKPPHHFLITGAPGIGKTSFVRSILQQRIDSGELEQLIWIDNPATSEFVRRHVTEYLIPEGVTIDIKEYLLAWPTAIVLDNIENLQDDIVSLTKLLDILYTAEVYMTSSYFVAMQGDTTQVALDELTGQETTTLVNSLPHNLSGEEVSSIWHLVGGNPSAIKLAAQNLEFGLADFNESLDRVYSTIYLHLSEELRYTWFVFAILPPQGISTNTLTQLNINMSNVHLLMRRHLIEVEENIFALPATARHFLQSRVTVLHDTQPYVDSFIKTLEGLIVHQPNLVLNIFESLLELDWLGSDLAQKRLWIEGLYAMGVESGHCAHWCAILGNFISHYDDVPPSIQIAYGTCLRRVGEWAEAETVLLAAIAQTGKHGKFADQAVALVELAKVYRYRGNYAKALNTLKSAQSTAQRQDDALYVEKVYLELAQIAIDSGESIQAQRLLERCQTTGRTLALQSETSLIIRDFETSEAYATQALNHFDQNSAGTARAHTLLGRSYVGQGNLEKAHHHLELSLTILEKLDDKYGIARAQLNLSTVLMNLGKYDEAYSLLRAAEYVQFKLKDRAALAATRHNLQILERMKLS